MNEHECKFPDVEIMEADEGDVLKIGDHVLGPCTECGELAVDSMANLQHQLVEMEKALLAVKPDRPMFHWSPRARLNQIVRYGLRPKMRPTTNIAEGFKAPYVCFADTPWWAWALSGEQRHSPRGEWDLWQTWLNDIPEPIVHPTPHRDSGLYEVRTEHRVYKSKLWHVGSRFK